MNAPARLTYINGPTALFEMCGVRLLTDPTFDLAPAHYPTSAYVLHKTMSPAVSPQAVEPIDVILLSHDHHFDNLDTAGRALLTRAKLILTTVSGATRLGGNAIGLNAWEFYELPLPNKRVMRITATPARHGPAGGDRGPVIGFVLTLDDSKDHAIYISGDTVWYEGVAEVSQRFAVAVAVLFMGAARVSAAGPSHLTFTSEEGVEAARAFSNAIVVPLHFEGWEHFSESGADIKKAFENAGLANRLRLPEAGRAMELLL